VLGNFEASSRNSTPASRNPRNALIPFIAFLKSLTHVTQEKFTSIHGNQGFLFGIIGGVRDSGR
jgi:hypothetical protein